MFKKILLPVDLTDRHGPVLDVAGELAALGGGEVILLHVIETLVGVSMEEERPFYGRLERAARGHLDRLGKQLTERKVSCRGEVLFGNRTQESIRYTTEAGVDLVILTAPRIDPDAPAANWSSLSYQLGILSHCPVLLIK